MSTTVSPVLFARSILHPREVFSALAKTDPGAIRVFVSYSVWLMLLPPVFAWLGAYKFGWRLGAQEPLRLEVMELLVISFGYFATLLFGFITTTVISRWMAATYGAKSRFGLHAALITIVGQPLALASAAHLFPHVFFNVIIMIPTLMWSMYLLYSGLPVILSIPPERGMLMASSLVGWLLVAAVSLLGITMGLWTAGFGPSLGV